jgi:hypothetical protein
LWPWTDQQDVTSFVQDDWTFPPDVWADQQRLNTTVWWLAGGTLVLSLLAAGGTWLVLCPEHERELVVGPLLEMVLCGR